jgi:methyl-accepting chemotaxis protein
MFKKIITDITGLNGEIQHIAAVMNELSESGRVIQDSVGELGDISAKTSKAAISIASATRAQSADMDNIAGSSSNLLSIVETLQAQMGRFNIGDTLKA